MPPLTFKSVGKRGFLALEDAVNQLPKNTQAVELKTDGLVKAADEVVVVVLTKHGAFVRKKSFGARKVSAKTLRMCLAGAEAAIDELEIDERQAPTKPQLTAAEALLLKNAGLSQASSDRPSALEKSRIELELLLRTSLTITQAAKDMRVSTSRIRQRLSANQRTLFGVKEGRSWRLPGFQFAKKGKLVRGIDIVLPHVRADAHPVAVRNWFTHPHQDLVVGADDEAVTPLEWLSAGGEPDTVAALANEI